VSLLSRALQSAAVNGSKADRDFNIAGSAAIGFVLLNLTPRLRLRCGILKPASLR
jgi:hypothetical protein